jgi:shikimate dehydrogenase
LGKINGDPVDIIINATSASLDGQMPNIAAGVANNAICYDLMYGRKTPFMDWAKANQQGRR